MIDNNDEVNILMNDNIYNDHSLIDFLRDIDSVQIQSTNSSVSNIRSEWSTTNIDYSNNYSTSALVELLTGGVEVNYNETLSRRDPLYIVIPVTIIYAIIFLTGLIGNVSTCVVIARNRSMHTATNYYLFSLAVSDLLLLVSGLPPEMYYIWSHFPYIFGEAFCIIQSFAAETSANATVLTITAFTVERYVAICHPFLSHTMSKLSRAVKYIVAIWLLALCLAIPQAIQFGVVYSQEMDGSIIPDTAMCSIKWVIIEHAFEISTILLFVVPMTIITVLYILIGSKLRHSRQIITNVKRNPFSGCLNHVDSGKSRGLTQRNVIRMLVAVVVAFFICWAPFHAQRLLAVYAQSTVNEPHAALVTVYTVLTYISGIFYYLSTTVNPLLYNIMSNKFRGAFKSMLAEHCGTRRSSSRNNMQRQTYSSLFRHAKSITRPPEPPSSSSASGDTRHLASVSHHHHQHHQNQRVMSNNYLEKMNSSNRKYTDNEGIDWQTTKSHLDTTEFSKAKEITLVTSLPKNFNVNSNNNNGISNAINRCLSKNDKSPQPVTIGIFADCSTFNNRLFMSQKSHPAKFSLENELALHKRPKLHSHHSIDSDNTISSTSLENLNKTEFTGSKFARYIGVINFDHIT